MRKSIVHDKGNIIKRKSVKNLLSLFLLLSILISFILVSFSVEGRYVGEKNLITLIPAKGCYKTDNSVYLVQGGIYLNGKYEGTDYCEDKSTLVEYYCYSSSPQSYFFKRIDCTKLPDRHNYHCENGACVSDSITASKCIRHGESIYTKGYVEYEGSKFEDYCDTNQYLVQYKCINGRPIPDELSQPCGYGCENGACLNQGQTQQTQTTQTQTITTSIQSNDCSNYQYGCYKKGGVNSQEKGYICENGYYMGSDNCAGGSYPTLLNEWVCENNKAVEKYYDCEMLGDDYICQNGACVLPNQPENWNWSNFIIDNQRWQSRTHDWFDMIMPQSVKDSFKQARDNSIRWLETNLGGNSNLWNAIFEGDYAAAICSVFFPMSTGNSVSVSYPSPQAASTFALMATKQKQTMPDGSTQYLYKIELMVGAGISSTGKVNFTLVNNDGTYVSINNINQIYNPNPQQSAASFVGQKVTYLVDNTILNDLGQYAISFYNRKNENQLCIKFNNWQDLQPDISNSLTNHQFCVPYEEVSH